MTMRRIQVAGGCGLAVHDVGEGPGVVLVPSLGRGAADFLDLADRLAGAGFRAVAIEPRGVAGSDGLVRGLDLHDLARDVLDVAAWMGGDPVHLVGHGFGQRVVRCAAADAPAAVRSVALLGAGGIVDPPEEVERDQVLILFSPLPEQERLALIHHVFFAPSSDPAAWSEGWWPQAAELQAMATRCTPVQDWWDAGGVPVLVVQPLEDRLVPNENGRRIVEQLGPRATLVEVPRAGHALLPEQPIFLADHLIGFCSRVESLVR
jgi:pimeloyl-ACP methyl ester carboxylesterase